MKKYIIITILLLVNTLSYSQDYIDIIGKETCECINAKKIDVSKSTPLELQSALGVCMMTSYSSYREKMSSNDRVEYGDSEGMRKLGESVGVKMLIHCPQVIMAIGGSLDDSKSAVEEKAIVLEGQFLEIKVNDFVSITVKDLMGRTHNLLLLNHFENAELITDKLLKKNEKVAISYKEHEFYDPKSKDFKYYKVIYSLTKI
jgi:hypothetical protein